MNPTPPRIGRIATWLLAASTACTLTAQTTPSTPKADEDVVRLSEFSVKADPNRGYAPSETMTGSRVATKIVDLPYTVNVMTSEFLEDFGVLEGTTQAFAYTSSVAAIDLSGTGNSTIRGFSSQYMLRDGFFRLGRTDPVVDDGLRAEFV